MELPQDRKVQEKYSGREAKVENLGAAACGILSLPAGLALVSMALGAWSTSLALVPLMVSKTPESRSSCSAALDFPTPYSVFDHIQSSVVFNNR